MNHVIIMLSWSILILEVDYKSQTTINLIWMESEPLSLWIHQKHISSPFMQLLQLKVKIKLSNRYSLQFVVMKKFLLEETN